LAKKDSHDERLKIALTALADAGVAVDTPSAASLPQLRAAFGQSTAMELAVAYLLGRIVEPAAIDLLHELERVSTDKEVKKEIKRAYFKLSQKGLAVTVEPQGERKSAPLVEYAPDIEAYMSAVDGGGGRLIWIAKRQPNHGLQVIQAMLHDRGGLLRFGGMQMKRKELRRMADEIKRDHGVSMIAVPWQFVDQIIYDGYEIAKARGQTGLEQFHEIRSIIATGKPKPITHPIYQKLSTADLREGPWREQSRRLLEEPELRYWILLDPWVREFLPKLQDAQTSPLVLNQMQKEERLAAIVRDAVKTLCGGANGAAFKRRMEDTALYFYETQRVNLAKLSLAVAQQVGEGDPGPLDISFLTGLVQKSFAFLLSQQKTQAEEAESSLIIKP